MRRLKFVPSWIRLAAVLLVASTAACSTLMRDSEQECTPHGGCRPTYLSKSVTGRTLTPDDTIAVFALASVSTRGHGTLQLTFYKLRESAQEYRLRDVWLIGARTITEGRPIQFEANGVSGTVRGEFDYASYFPAIPIDVHVGSGTTAYTCRLRFEFSRTYSLADSVHGEPQIPGTMAEFLALAPPTPIPPRDLRRTRRRTAADSCRQSRPGRSCPRAALRGSGPGNQVGGRES